METMNEKKKKKFFSINLKWSLGTGLGVVIIFAVFATLLFQSFSSLLIRQEKGHSEEAMNAVTLRLAQSNSTLTDTGVRDILSSSWNDDIQNRKQAAIYSDSVLTATSGKNIGISVYSVNKELLFASRGVLVDFSSKNKQKITKINGQTVYIVRRPVYSNKSNKLIGYVQVTNKLVDYDATRHKLILIFIVFGVTAGLASALVGYVLSAWLLRPIELINETIGKINTDDERDSLANVRVPILNQNDELSELSNLFNDMLDRMERYIQQQQQFVEDVSHELRTPVAIIQGHLDLLSRWGKDDPQILEESISASLQEITRMKSLVQEMLDLSRAEQVELQFGNEVSDAREVGLQVFNNFKMIHPDFTFVLDNDLKNNTPVKIYRNHLEQVLIILMDNAVKYSQDRKEVHMSISKNSKLVEFVVQDFGVGISQENIDKIFDRFYRVDKARSRDKGGNGLGLSIARKLVEGYHGSMSVESVEGQGSLFRISLPLVDLDNKK